MTTTVTDFPQIRAQRPDPGATRAAYDVLVSRFEAAADTATRCDIVREWDRMRREAQTWRSMTHLHFEQDLRNPEYRAEQELLEELEPKLTALDIEMKRRFLASAHRADLEREFGAHIFCAWAIDISAFDPAIENDLVHEARLSSEYTSIVGSAEIQFDGKVLNLAGLEPYMRGADRDVRHGAQTARWAFYAAHAGELDRIYSELVAVRDTMARKLGYENYVALGYKRMKRLDYRESDVARYRKEVLAHIVPLASEIVRKRGERLGLGRPMYWDESLHDNAGNPRPGGDRGWIVQQGAATFHALHPELGSFYDLMVAGELVDLENRPGKAGGGFCTSFPTVGLPFVFANFNGSEHDVVVLLHEMGHAFQNYRSRDIALLENIWPTMETAEVHSMSMEFLAFNEMERFFGDDAQRYRDHHLAEALLFIPYGVAIDHFQHLVYERPQATAQERHEMWQEVERLYLPWRAYGDLSFPAKGGLWQEKRHIYLMPFYYIDYTLAQCCALQFWARSRDNFESALSDYISLCSKGGTAPFLSAIRAANLRSPFEEGALFGVATAAKNALGLAPTA